MSESSPDDADDSGVITRALKHSCSRHNFPIPSNKNSCYLANLFYHLHLPSRFKGRTCR